jgi:oligopeptide/dipeptide ABC transporter ATP-binding protein
MSMVFVTHDLGVVADVCDRVIVMYAGQIVEQATVHELFSAPKHPYTRQLLKAIPQATPRGQRLASVPGVVPVPGSWAQGCRFNPRCPYATDQCRAEPVAFTQLSSIRAVRCLRHADVAALDER